MSPAVDTRPDTYQEWRRRFQFEQRCLGVHIHFNLRFGRPLMDRETWKIHSRILRLQKRLDAEAGACTDSYCWAVVEATVGQREG